MKKTLATLALGTMLIGAGSAHAAETFTLNNVAFSDGTAITGSFTTDDAFTGVKAFSIATSAGSIFFGNDTFSSDNGDTATLSSSGLSLQQPGVFGTYLDLDFSTPLSAAGSSIIGGDEHIFVFGRSIVSGGTVSLVAPAAGAVPEPATWGMMLAGFGMIGFAARKRSSVKTTVSYA